MPDGKSTCPFCQIIGNLSEVKEVNIALYNNGGLTVQRLLGQSRANESAKGRHGRRRGGGGVQEG